MKKIGLLILCLLMFSLPCRTEECTEQEASTVDIEKPIIFIYHIPDEETSQSEIEREIQSKTEVPDIISDDVTADTSPALNQEDDENIASAEEDYEIDDLYTDVLKGYAVYEESDIIFLDDDFKNFQELNIKLPAKVSSSKYSAPIHFVDYRALTYSKFNNVEYSIAPISKRNYRKIGGFSAGTLYSQGIDYAELEQSTGVFSRYETKYFAISTAYSKTVNTTNNNYNDNFYFSPEFKLNQYFTLKQILSADITRNRKKAEIVLSINPFGNRDLDRLRFEFGANATYDHTNTLLRNQLKVSTKFKL